MTAIDGLPCSKGVVLPHQKSVGHGYMGYFDVLIYVRHAIGGCDHLLHAQEVAF